MKMNGQVVLFKDDVADCKYRSLLQDDAFVVHTQPVLQFENVEQGIQKLNHIITCDAHNYWGVVLTSPRASEIFAKCVDLATINLSWTVFVVGQKTAKPISSTGLVIKGIDAGSAANLVPFIIEEAPSNQNKSLLFISGETRMPTIPEQLALNNIPFMELTVYRSAHITNVTLPKFDLSQQVFLVFFSPSGTSCVEKTKPVLPQNTILVAIGKTTSAALQDSTFWSVYTVVTAEKPNPEGVHQAIMLTINNNSK